MRIKGGIKNPRRQQKARLRQVRLFAACAVSLKQGQKGLIKNPPLRVAVPVGRTPFGNKNLKNNELGYKPAFKNREELVLEPEFCWLRSIECIAQLGRQKNGKSVFLSGNPLSRIIEMLNNIRSLSSENGN